MENLNRETLRRESQPGNPQPWDSGLEKHQPALQPRGESRGIPRDAVIANQTPHSVKGH